MKSAIAECINCHKKLYIISKSIGICVNCIREHYEKVSSHLRKIHRDSRIEFNLLPGIPRHPDGVLCAICQHECRIPEGGRGYCGIRRNCDGELIGGGTESGIVDYYYDAIPTNCVADWVCPANCNTGYPDYSNSPGVEYGYNNLAVFYRACNFNCLFCQNWHFRKSRRLPIGMTAAQLADKADEKTACICYFGGDPGPQLLHAIETSRIALERSKGRILRICWETNGSMNPGLLEKMIELSLKSGGCIKFDLKAWSDKVHKTLCGVTNRRTLSNFELVARAASARPKPPLLVASTLLVPGYVDEMEIRGICRFIASLNPNIPYALLAFHPDFLMDDLPATSGKHAHRARDIASEEGLTKVKIGNAHLLGKAY